jgi:hypothetical protein
MSDNRGECRGRKFQVASTEAKLCRSGCHESRSSEAGCPNSPGVHHSPQSPGEYDPDDSCHCKDEGSSHRLPNALGQPVEPTSKQAIIDRLPWRPGALLTDDIGQAKPHGRLKT